MKTEKGRVAAAIALHNPSKLFRRNKSLLKVPTTELHKMAIKPTVSKRKSPMDIEREKVARKRRG